MGVGVAFAVAGAKGGVGKTTTSINLSAVLTELGHEVVLVELDLAMANVCDFLDLDVRLEHGREPTLHEVLADAADVSEATYEAPGGFDVVPSGTTLRGFANADVGATGGVVEELRTQYDIVVLDTGAGLGAETVLPLSIADETVLVSSPRVASVRDTKKTRDLVRHVGGTVAGVVFVKSGSGRSPGVDRIAEFLSVDLLGHVPEDSAVASAQDIGRPVVVAEKDSGAAKAYRALGSRIHERVGACKAARANEARTEVEADDADADEPLSTGDEADDDAGFTFVGGSAGSASTEAEEGSTAAGSGASGGTPASAGDTSSPTGEDGGVSSTADGPAVRGGESETQTATSPTNAGGDRKPAPRGGRRQPDSPAASRPVGATDDEIAARLASVEAGSDTRSTRERQSGPHAPGHTPLSTNGATGEAKNGAVDGADSGATGEATNGAVDGADSGATDEATNKVADEAKNGATSEEKDGTAEPEPSPNDDWDSKQSATKRFIDRAINLVDRGDD